MTPAELLAMVAAPIAARLAGLPEYRLHPRAPAASGSGLRAGCTAIDVDRVAQEALDLAQAIVDKATS